MDRAGGGGGEDIHDLADTVKCTVCSESDKNKISVTNV